MATSPNSVLIVDADKKSRETLALNFEKMDWIVHTTDNGRNATQSMHRNNPDIIIMDISLPVRDGITTCRLMRNDVSAIQRYPIIMMTSSPNKKLIVEAVEAGCDDFIIKPFKFERLLEKIKAHVQFHQKKEEEKEIVIYAKKNG